MHYKILPTETVLNELEILPAEQVIHALEKITNRIGSKCIGKILPTGSHIIYYVRIKHY